MWCERCLCVFGVSPGLFVVVVFFKRSRGHWARGAESLFEIRFVLHSCPNSVCCAQSCSRGSFASDALHTSVLVFVPRSPRHVMLCRSEKTTNTGNNLHMVIHCSFCWYCGRSVSRVVFTRLFAAVSMTHELDCPKIRARGVMCHDVGALHFGMYLMACFKNTRIIVNFSPRRPSAPQVVGVPLREISR